MSKGFITIAQNSGSYDYLKMAYALALSIKQTQSTVDSFAVCVEPGTKIPKKYKKVFDYVIEIPGDDDAHDHKWKIHNKWKYYEMSPFDETIILDADMIFNSDISSWWDAFRGNIGWADRAFTFRNEAVKVDKHYRLSFIENRLPNVYTAFFYFKKSKQAKQFFDLCKDIYHNWHAFTLELARKHKPATASGDMVFSYAIAMLGIENCLTQKEKVGFTHMKSFIQNVPSAYLTENWTQHFPVTVTNEGDIYVNNYKQLRPFHYHIKGWLTDEIIKQLEYRNV